MFAQEKSLQCKGENHESGLWIDKFNISLAVTLAQSNPVDMNLPECHAIYDAGSSETRLYIYYLEKGKWIKKKGPTAPAFANVEDRTLNSEAASDSVNLLNKFKDNADKEKAFDWLKK